MIAVRVDPGGIVARAPTIHVLTTGEKQETKIQVGRDIRPPAWLHASWIDDSGAQAVDLAGFPTGL